MNPYAFVLPPDASAAATARRRLEDLLAETLAPDALHSALLAVSELVTNAVRHGAGQVTVRAERRADRLRLEVVDEGDGAADGAVRIRPGGADGGWGLQLVDAMATRWGVFEGTTHVWCDLPLR